MRCGNLSTEQGGLPLIVLETDCSEPLFFLVDTGSAVSLIQESVLTGHIDYMHNDIDVKSVSGEMLDIQGQLDVKLRYNLNEIKQHRFLVVKKDFDQFQGILGHDWLQNNEAIINFKERGLYIENAWIPFLRMINTKSLRLTACLKTERKIRKEIECFCVQKRIKIHAARDVVIPTLSYGNIPVNWDTRGVSKRNESVILLEPVAKRKSDLEGLQMGRTLCNLVGKANAMPTVNDEKELGKANVMPTVKKKNFVGKSWMPYVNPEGKNIEVKKGDVVAIGTVMTPDSGNKNGEKKDKVYVNNVSIVNDTGLDKPEEIEKLIKNMINKSECPPENLANLEQLLNKYTDILAKKGDPVGLCDLYEPSISLDTEEPIYVAQYPIPYKMRSEMKKSVDEFLKEGIIQYSKSPYNAPTIMVTKKDEGFRMVIDYRKLNLHVVTDPFPIPRIDQILEELGGCQFFSALDLLNGFYNLKIRPEDRLKTAFSTYEGHYEFVRLPMGLKNSPSIFQRMMNIVLAGCLGKFAYIYIDDIVIYSKTAEEHLIHLERILQSLREANLRIKFSKCQIFKTSIEYLGFLVSKDGLMVNPKKLKSVAEFPTPKDMKGVQAFLGLVGYFRIFIKDFAKVARPLYDLLKKSITFKWTKTQENAFQILKNALMKAPVLAFPDFSKEFILTTDASHYALGAVLTQETDEGEKLISCASRSLKGAEMNYSNTDREILAVVFGVKHNRSYLWGHKFRVKTDHSAIPYLQRNTSNNARAIRWFLELSEYDYTIAHKKGTRIQHADALSRYPVDKIIKGGKVVAYLSPSMASTEFEPLWDMDEWKNCTQADRTKPEIDDKNYIEKNGLIYYIKTGKQLLWVPVKLRNYVMKACHDPPSMGHRGVDKTYAYMKANLNWKYMEEDIRSFIKCCDMCQRFKHFRHMSPTHRVPVPMNVFDEVSIDVVGPVPISQVGNRYILVIQDRLSRWLMFCPMTNQSAETVVRVFLTKWVCVYGVPKKLISDRGTNFVSELFHELHKFLGIRPSNTCAYRPQGNGMNERSHQGLHQYLAMYLTPSNRATWDTMINLASWVHNSSEHESLKASPFEIVTGVKPRSAQAWIPQPGENIHDISNQFQSYYGVDRKYLNDLREKAREAITKAQDDYLIRLNRYAKDMVYKIGDLVLIRIQDRSTYIARKWEAKYKGPYVISAIIGPGVVKIQDLKTKFEDIIHVVYLRPYNKFKSPPGSPKESEEDEEENDIRGSYLELSLTPELHGVEDHENSEVEMDALSLKSSIDEGNSEFEDETFLTQGEETGDDFKTIISPEKVENSKCLHSKEDVLAEETVAGGYQANDLAQKPTVHSPDNKSSSSTHTCEPEHELELELEPEFEFKAQGQSSEPVRESNRMQPFTSTPIRRARNFLNRFSPRIFGNNPENEQSPIRRSERLERMPKPNYKETKVYFKRGK